MRGVVSPPCTRLRRPGKQRTAQPTGTSLPRKPSALQLLGALRTPAGTCCPHGGGVQLCCHPSASSAPSSIHTQSTGFAPSKGSPLLAPAASNRGFPPTPAVPSASKLPHTEQNTLHHLRQAPGPQCWESQTRPGLTLPFLKVEDGVEGEEKTRANPFAADFKVIVSRSLRNSLSTK